MSAREGDGDRSLGGEVVEGNEPAGLVGQQEGRHGVANLRRLGEGRAGLEAGDQAVDGVGERRIEGAHRVGVGGEPFVERGVERARLLEGLFNGAGGHGRSQADGGRLAHNIGSEPWRKAGAL